jgi:hypothetical protein
MKWYQDQDRFSLTFLVASLAVHCSVGWRAYASFSASGSLWPVISGGSIYNRYETIILAIAMVTGLFVTLRNMRMSGLKTKWTTIFVSVFLLGVFVIASHAVILRTLSKMSTATPFYEKHLTTLTEFVNDPINRLGDRVQISRILSSGRFIKTGEITDFLDYDGKIKKYHPTLEDKIIRNGKIHLKGNLIPSFKRNLFVWSVILLVAFLAGLLVPVKENFA